MAYSSSIKRAQAIKLCELCNEDNIKWRCVDCDRCLCQKCRNIHLKVPVTAIHQIVTIATPIHDVQRKIVTDNILCKDHVTKMNCLFCETCGCLVCLECVSSSHTKHKFIQIETALDNKMEQMEGIQAKVSDNLKFCDSKIQEIQNLISKYYSIFDESVTKIKQKEQELKEAISKYSKLLQEKVETERLKVKTIVRKVEQEVINSRKKLQELEEKLETALTSNQGQVIFETTLTQPVLTFDPIPHKVENFISRANTETQIQELFGSFKTMMIPSFQPEMRFEVLRTFTTDLPVIQQVIPLNETSAWIRCRKKDKSVMRKVTIEGNNLVTSSETTLNISITDMALSPDNTSLLAVDGESDVKLITKSGDTKTFLTIPQLCPSAIHVTCDSNVIVGVVEHWSKGTTTDNSQRAVCAYDKDGNQKHKYQHDRNGKRLFSYPFRITSNNNQDIFVIDWKSYESGRVVTLDREGDLRWIYDGNSQINVTEQFSPRGITATTCYIIVSDINSHALHVLSENGDVLTYKSIDDVGIMYPMGLDIDKEEKLWVVCDSRKGSGAKLHIVKLAWISPNKA